MRRYGNKISEYPESIRKRQTARNIHSQIQSQKQQKPSVVQICASGDPTIFSVASRRSELDALCRETAQFISAPIIASWNYHASSLILQAAMKSCPHISTTISSEADVELMKNSPIGLIIYKFHKRARQRSSLRRAAISHNGQHNLLAPSRKVHLSWGSVFELSLPLA